MDIQATIEKNKRNIWQAINDYGAHTYQTYILEDVSEQFVDRLARDNAYSKRELRHLFRKSPVWNEELDALVINGTRTHNADYKRIRILAEEILSPVRMNVSVEDRARIDSAIRFFANPDEDPAPAISAMQEIAPNAYAPGKKPSRIFRALCDALEVSDNSAGSRFQQLYAQFADELSSKKIRCEIDERLYCSDCKESDDDDDEDESVLCDECDQYFSNTYPVYDSRGNTIYVCAGCRDRYYFYCEECDSYYPKETMTIVNGDVHVCPDCLERKYRKCEECGEYFLKEDVEDGLCPTCRAAHEEEVGAVA